MDPSNKDMKLSWLLRAVARLLPQRLRTRRMNDGLRVDALTHDQRERLRENLQRLVSPKAA